MKGFDALKAKLIARIEAEAETADLNVLTNLIAQTTDLIKSMQKYDRVEVDEIKQIFNCSERRAYEIMNHPSFPAVRTGKNIHVFRVSLDQWILERHVIDFTETDSTSAA